MLRQLNVVSPLHLEKIPRFPRGSANNGNNCIAHEMMTLNPAAASWRELEMCH
jgi:hypothetical protein